MLVFAILCVFLNTVRPTVAQWGDYGGSWGTGGSYGDGSYGDWSSSNSFPFCGATISQTVQLMADLVCDCSAGPALVIEGTGNVLDLNGHFVSCSDGSLGPDDVGIRVEGKSNSIVGPGNVTESSVGIELDGEGGHTISRVSIYDIRNQGIHVQSDSNTIDETSIELTESHGIEINSDRNTVSNSVIYKVGGTFIYMLGGSFNLVERNRLDNAVDGFGIHARDTIGNRFLYNVLSNTGSRGIYLENGEDHEVRGNEFFGIGNNSVIDIDANNVHVIENHIYNNNGRGIMTRGESNVIERNVVTGNTMVGIQCVGCDKCSFKGNIVDNNTREGFYFQSSNYNVLSDNIVTNNGMDGIFLSVHTSNAVLTRNTSWGNAGDDLVNNSNNIVFSADNTVEKVDL